MQPIRIRRPRTWRGVLIASAVLGAAGVVVAETVKVQRPTANVVDAIGAAGETVETVNRDAELTVLERKGKWMRVRTPSGKEGYVPAVVVASSGGGSPLGAMFGGADASAAHATAAGRGWDQEVESYATSKNLSRDGLTRMESMRQQCLGSALKDFQKQGKLGTAR